MLANQFVAFLEKMNELSFSKSQVAKPSAENGFMKLNQARANQFALWTKKKANKATKGSIAKDQNAMKGTDGHSYLTDNPYYFI